MDKALPTVAEAVADIPDGAMVMIGGFGGSGAPIELIHALIDRFRATGSPAAITVVNNNAGNGYCGIAAMIKVGMVRKMICSFPRSSNAEAFNEDVLALADLDQEGLGVGGVVGLGDAELGVLVGDGLEDVVDALLEGIEEVIVLEDA